MSVSRRRYNRQLLRCATTAAAAGTGETDWGPMPRVQIVTVEQLLTSPACPVRIPMARSDTYRKAAKEERPDRQGSLGL